MLSKNQNKVDQAIFDIVKHRFASDWQKFEGYVNELARKAATSTEKTNSYPNQTIITKTDRKVLIGLSGISKEYNLGGSKVAALNNINLDIYEGEFIAIVGPSGSGKSTLLQILGGLDKPDKGSVFIEGQDLAKFNDDQLSLFRNKTVGFIFQSFYLQPFLNVLQNTEIPLIFRKASNLIRRNAATKAIEAVGLTNRIRHLPRQLSGGQMQRVGIARAIVNEPKIVLADEPTANLDSVSTQEIIKLLKKINREKNITVIVVTHNKLVAQHANRIIKLTDGQIQ